MAYTTINKSGDYFNTVLHTGDGASPKSITGFGFQPDLVWTKTRSNTNNHTLFDSVRGAGASKELSSNSSTAEGGVDTTNYGYLSSFDSDGFTATSGSSGTNYFNESGATYVNWNWKANGTGVSNTSGSINSTVSANTASGFSIVKWTGNGSTATIGHGLGVAPSVILVKNYSASMNWISYWKALGANKYLEFNLANAAGTGTTEWNNTSPTSSVFSVGNTGSGNQSGGSLIAYCFADVQGYSKVSGSYVGNGNSSSGTFVYTGFKPAFVLFKSSTVAGSQWYIYDNKRNESNITNNKLYPNLTNAESSGDNQIDILSNGFKMRSGNGDSNNSGSTYIYMAFGQSIVGSNNVPCTAR